MDKYLHFLRQRSTFTFVVIALLVAHLLPLWVFKYFPSQDGASHIYNAYLLKEYNNPAMYKVRECFELNLTLFPNWFSHALMAGLMFVVSPLVAEKILLTSLHRIGTVIAFLLPACDCRRQCGDAIRIGQPDSRFARIPFRI